MGTEFLHIPDGWNVKPLIECTSDKVISYGIVQPGSHDEDGVPVLRVNNFNDNTLDTTNVLKVSPEIEKKFSRTRLKGGEVLLTLVGSTGQSVVAPPSLAGWNVPRAIAVIRPEDSIGADWINICLQSSATKGFLDSRANTTVQKTLNLQDVKQIPILLPPPSVKEFIECVATTLNNKIELNRQINTTLESMSQALFKSWFVDFDPVIDNALAAGNPIPEPLMKRAQARAEKRQELHAAAQATQSANGSTDASPLNPLPTEIQQLFPSSFVFTEEMGWVPEGWEAASLMDLCWKITDGAHQSPPSVEQVDGLPMASSKDLTTQGISIDSCRFISRKDFESLVNNGCMPEKGDVLISKDGSRCGETCCIHFSETPVVLLSSVAILKPKNEIYTIYMNTLLSRKETIQNLRENFVSGSAIPRIVLKDFKRYPLVKPSDSVFQAWDTLTRGWIEKSHLLNRHSESLKALRDALLPKLLSGQLQIPEAEQQLAEVI